MPQREYNWNNFTKWCQKFGIPDMDKFEIKKVDEDEYGLFCNSNFFQNDIILQVPRKLFLTNETALNDSKLGKFQSVLRIVFCIV